MGVEHRTRVVMHIEVAEGSIESSLVGLWKIADGSRVYGKAFSIGFEREVGEDNEPQKIYVNVYSGEDWVASYDLMDEGLTNLHVEKKVVGLPEIPDELSDLEGAIKVLEFVQEVVQEASTVHYSLPPNS